MNAILIVTLFFLLNKSTKTVNKDDNGVDRANNDDAKRNGGETMIVHVKSWSSMLTMKRPHGAKPMMLMVCILPTYLPMPTHIYTFASK